MIYPSADELEKKVESKYSLVIAVAKRAKQLREGATALVESKSSNPITIALEEIAAGKISIGMRSPEEIEAAGIEAPAERPKAPEVSELLRIPAEESDKEESETGNSESEEIGELEAAVTASTEQSDDTAEKEKAEE